MLMMNELYHKWKIFRINHYKTWDFNINWYIWKSNRIARNMLKLLQIVDLLEKNNISFKWYAENFETETTMGKFSLQMMGAVGELERGTIAQNVT